jgi:hypothetical protein
MGNSNKNTPIQRTIEEVDPQTNTTVGTLPANASSGKSVLFGLAAVLLIVIAIVAAAVLLKDSKRG